MTEVERRAGGDPRRHLAYLKRGERTTPKRPGPGRFTPGRSRSRVVYFVT